MQHNLHRLCGLALVCGFLAAPASAETGYRRIVSLNVCADQFLIALGLGDRIAALGPIATDPGLSHYAEAARGLPRTGGRAEEVLLLEPDVVLAGPFAGLVAKKVLADAGTPIIELPIPQTIDEARGQILDVAELLGVAERGAAIVAELDAALAAPLPPGPAPRALYLQRRLFVTGTGTLVDDLLSHTGFANALAARGRAGIDRVGLEELVEIPADVLVLDGEVGRGSDQGEAALLHPLVETLFPRDRRILLPLSSIVCAGPPLVEAVRTLQAARARLVRP